LSKGLTKGRDSKRTSRISFNRVGYLLGWLLFPSI
jgi:hypothetical protein